MNNVGQKKSHSSLEPRKEKGDIKIQWLNYRSLCLIQFILLSFALLRENCKGLKRPQLYCTIFSPDTVIV
jgi:hypothetical protein